MCTALILDVIDTQHVMKHQFIFLLCFKYLFILCHINSIGRSYLINQFPPTVSTLCNLGLLFQVKCNVLAIH